MYCRPVCFANSLSQHIVVEKEKLILWGNLNSRGACTSCGASVYYKPLNNSYLASLVLLHICLLFLSSRMMFLKSYCCYVAPEVAFSFSFFKSFHDLICQDQQILRVVTCKFHNLMNHSKKQSLHPFGVSLNLVR